jgi:hypothetical protein
MVHRKIYYEFEPPPKVTLIKTHSDIFAFKNIITNEIIYDPNRIQIETSDQVYDMKLVINFVISKYNLQIFFVAEQEKRCQVIRNYIINTELEAHVNILIPTAYNTKII